MNCSGGIVPGNPKLFTLPASPQGLANAQLTVPYQADYKFWVSGRWAIWSHSLLSSMIYIPKCQCISTHLAHLGKVWHNLILHLWMSPEVLSQSRQSSWSNHSIVPGQHTGSKSFVSFMGKTTTIRNSMEQQGYVLILHRRLSKFLSNAARANVHSDLLSKQVSHTVLQHCTKHIWYVLWIWVTLQWADRVLLLIMLLLTAVHQPLDRQDT